MNELLPSGLAFLRAVDSFTEGVKDPARALTDELGLLTTTAGSLIAAAKNWREISAELERRVDKLSIQRLQIISQAMNKTTDPEGVREALVAYATRPTDARREPTADELKRYAQTVVAGNKPKKPRCSLLFSRHEDATGTRYAQLALPSTHMERFEALVRKWWPGDKEKEKSPALKNAIGLQRLLNVTSGTDGDGRWDLSIVPAFIVSAPGTTYVGDGKFVTTDGDVLSGNDIADYHLRDFGYVTVYDGHGNIGCHYLRKTNGSPARRFAPLSSWIKSFAPPTGVTNSRFTPKRTTPSPSKTVAKPTRRIYCSPANHTTSTTMTIATPLGDRKTDGSGATNTAEQDANHPTTSTSDPTSTTGCSTRGVASH